MCVAQKRLYLSSLICLKGVVSYTQATVPQLHHLACRFFLPLLCFFSSLFAFSSFLPVGFFIPASPSCVMLHQSIPPALAPHPPTPPGYCGPSALPVSPEGGAFASDVELITKLTDHLTCKSLDKAEIEAITIIQREAIVSQMLQRGLLWPIT